MSTIRICSTPRIVRPALFGLVSLFLRNFACSSAVMSCRVLNLPARCDFRTLSDLKTTLHLSDGLFFCLSSMNSLDPSSLHLCLSPSGSVSHPFLPICIAYMSECPLSSGSYIIKCDGRGCNFAIFSSSSSVFVATFPLPDQSISHPSNFPSSKAT